MADEQTTVPPAAGGGIAAELAAAGFADAKEAGRGASGVVYRCNQTALGRNVAVKVLGSELDEANRERFLREGYAMGRLSGHPNIVNILQVGVTSNGRPYIVMPFHSADSLAQRLQRSGPLAWPETLRIGVKLCGALETAHKAGTLHRDIKPGNVLTTDYGEPQLTDFGIARIDGGFKTVTGFFSGTIAFTAPEVLSGEQPTVTADIYSVGATLYALIAGTAAHDNSTGEQLIAQYMRIVSSPIPDMRLRGIPADVCTAIERSMSLDPSKRFASASELGRELQSIQRRNGLPPDNMALASPGGEDSEGVPTTGFNLPGMSKRLAGPSKDSASTAPFSSPRGNSPMSGPQSNPSSHQNNPSGPPINPSSHQNNPSGPPNPSSHQSNPQPWHAPQTSVPPFEHGEPTSWFQAPQQASGSMASQPVAPWMSPPQQPPPQQPPGPEAAAKPTNRQRMWVIGAAAGLALLLVIGLVVFFKSGDDKNQQ